jgi:hypothetical protein
MITVEYHQSLLCQLYLLQGIEDTCRVIIKIKDPVLKTLGTSQSIHDSGRDTDDAEAVRPIWESTHEIAL